MTDITPSHDLFRPKLSRSETKAQITDRSARSIIEAEAELRERKTEKLRLERLESEALEIATSVLTPKQRATGPKRTSSPSGECRSSERAVS